MEEAVPETPGVDSSEHRPTGPVTPDGPSSSRDDAAVEEPTPTPPAGEVKETTSGGSEREAEQPPADSPASDDDRNLTPSEEDAGKRLMARDLIAPSRHDAVAKDEEPEKACQNEPPRRCISVCEAIVASAACCGVGDGDVEADVEPRFGEEGGVGYADTADVEADAKNGTVWFV